MFEPTKEPLIAFLQRKLNIDYCRKHSFIANETGVSQSTISRIARGKAPNLDAAQSLLDFFIKDITPAPKKGAGK